MVVVIVVLVVVGFLKGVVAGVVEVSLDPAQTTPRHSSALQSCRPIGSCRHWKMSLSLPTQRRPSIQKPPPTRPLPPPPPPPPPGRVGRRLAGPKLSLPTRTSTAPSGKPSIRQMTLADAMDASSSQMQRHSRLIEISTLPEREKEGKEEEEEEENRKQLDWSLFG